ncbi:hypothetical protein [Salinicoccus roseus]|uniref:hypothetical protein n=1 Tax=Salinicoccus roseus TaxID=45670 RepID=UPI0023002702|nr:hypothetical protein [Salinicoccus roseus]
MFAFDLKGVEQTIDDLERILGHEALMRAKDAALKKGAEFMKRKIYEAQWRARRTGATATAITFSEPRWVDGERVITIHWGDEQYRVIHLLENGFYGRDGDFVKPKNNYGLIENTMAANRSQYLKIVADELQRQIAG